MITITDSDEIQALTEVLDGYLKHKGLPGIKVVNTILIGLKKGDSSKSKPLVTPDKEIVSEELNKKYK